MSDELPVVEGEKLENAPAVVPVADGVEPVDATETAPVDPVKQEQEEQKPRKHGLKERFAELTSTKRQALEEKRIADERYEKLLNVVKQLAPDADLTVAPKTIEQEASEAIQSKEWIDKVKRGEKSYSDWNDVVLKNNDLELSPSTQLLIAESDIGDDLLYYFCQNPDEANILNAARPREAARQIGRIEAMIENERANKKPAPVTKAPVPIEPVSSKGSGVVSIDQMSDDQWYKLYGKKNLRK